MSQVRVCVAGAGYFAQFHHAAWARLDGAELAGICDRDGAKAQHAAGSYRCAHFEDFGTMLDKCQPDLVDIVVPPEAHLDLIARCMARHIPVVCQKPFCATPQDARRAAALSDEAGVFIAVHENFRFQPWYREARRVLDAGRLGDVYQITFRLRPGDGQGGDAYLARQPYFRQMPRFLVHETGVHWIDTFRFLFGDPSAVFADLRKLNPVIAGEDAGVLLFDLPGGVRGILDGNRLVDHASDNPRRTMGEMLIEGSAASLRLDGQGQLHVREHGAEVEQVHLYAWRDEGFGGDCVHALCEHVVAHMVEGAPLENAASDYLLIQAVERAAYASAQAGCWQRIADHVDG